MNTPPVVSPQEWEEARKKLLVKEKAVLRFARRGGCRRHRMPWMAVETKYKFEGPKGKATLLDLFEGRPQRIFYRAFFEPGVLGWPEHACRGCSLGADQVLASRTLECAQHELGSRRGRVSPTSSASRNAWNGKCRGTRLPIASMLRR